MRQQKFHQPITLHLSLYNTGIDASNYEFVLSEVLTPIRQVVCDIGIYLVSSRVNGDLLCQDTNAVFPTIESIFNATSSQDKQIPQNTILMPAPIIVMDRKFDETIQWTIWTIPFHVLQIGKEFLDMDDTSNYEYVVNLLNEFLLLSLQAKIMDHSIDDFYSTSGHDLLTNAHLSLVNNEVETWSNYGIFDGDVLSKVSIHRHDEPLEHTLIPPDALEMDDADVAKNHFSTQVPTLSYLGIGILFGGVILVVTMWARPYKLNRQRSPTEMDYSLLHETDDDETISIELALRVDT